MLFLVTIFTLWFYNFIKTMEKRKKADDIFLREKKTEEKQNGVTIMISVDGNGTAFPVKLDFEKESQD